MKSEPIILDAVVVKDWNWVKWVVREKYYRIRNWWWQNSPSRIWRLMCLRKEKAETEDLLRRHIFRMRMHRMPTEELEKAFEELRQSIRGEKKKS